MVIDRRTQRAPPHALNDAALLGVTWERRRRARGRCAKIELMRVSFCIMIRAVRAAAPLLIVGARNLHRHRCGIDVNLRPPKSRIRGSRVNENRTGTGRALLTDTWRLVRSVYLRKTEPKAFRSALKASANFLTRAASAASARTFSRASSVSMPAATAPVRIAAVSMVPT